MSRRTHLLLALFLLGSLALGSLSSQQASGDVSVCNQVCVMMIEIDGLVPTDLDPVATPLLWELAHQGQQRQTPSPSTNPITGPAPRHGYMWQAPRGVMSAGSAPAALSLLTGGFTEQHGVPADEFLELSTGSPKFRRFNGPQDSAATGTEEDPEPITDPDAATIFQLLADGETNADYAWIAGHPGLRELLDADAGEAAAKWAPAAASDGNYPSYCPVPRQPSQENVEQACPASDSQTINQAISRLQSPVASDVAFTYIHLAGLGQTKLRDGNVPDALKELEFALGRFLQSYSTNAQTAARWEQTVMMVVGNHGYERTGLMRVPHATAEGRDLESYLEGGVSAAGIPPEGEGGVTFVPQGTFATVYAKGSDAAQRAKVIKAVRAELLRPGAGSVEERCAALAAEQQAEPPPAGEEPPPAGEEPAAEPVVDPDCIGDVLYVNPAFDTTNTVDKAHPSWHYDHISAPKRDKPAARSGTSGELIVTAGKGWAFGRAATTVTGTTPAPVTNAYPAAAGGPRNRAIAAFINGPERVVKVLPATRQWHPVTKGTDTGDERQEAQFNTLAEANANPGDDANTKGHELQPETVDFMPTAAALLRLSVDQRQLSSEQRLLGEAFRIPLAFPIEVEDIGPAPVEDDPPPAPPPIIIPAPPPPPEPPPPAPGYDFYGLLRDLHAEVIDANGNTYADAKPRTLMSHMVVKADFGRPLTMVTLTFYREVLSSGDRSAARRCSAIGARARRASCIDRLAARASSGLKRDLKRCNQQEERAKRQSCRYEVRARTRFERQKKERCAETLATRLRRARGGRSDGLVKKALTAPCLVPLAKFDPFTVKRAQVELKLKVPPAYGPSHVGVTVQEVRKMTATERARERRRMEDKDKPLFPYVGFGPKDGGIAVIADAGRLHRPKPRPRRARAR